MVATQSKSNVTAISSCDHHVAQNYTAGAQFTKILTTILQKSYDIRSS